MADEGDIIVMVIIWSGLGWLVPIIIILGGIVAFMEGPRRDITFAIGFLLASAFLWILGNFLNYGDIPPFVVNKASREGNGRGEHSFYYINMELWAFLPLAVLVCIFTVILYLRTRPA